MTPILRSVKFLPGWKRILASFCCETSPEGATQESPGRKPWGKVQQQWKPRKGEAVCAGSKEVPYDESLQRVEREPPCAALSGLCATLTLNPGLTPWAILLDPFGVPSFAPENS